MHLHYSTSRFLYSMIMVQVYETVSTFHIKLDIRADFIRELSRQQYNPAQESEDGEICEEEDQPSTGQMEMNFDVLQRESLCTACGDSEIIRE